jgi:hypothetical protein
LKLIKTGWLPKIDSLIPLKNRLNNLNSSLIKRIPVYMSQAKAKEEVQAEKNQYSLIGYKEVLMRLALKQI